MLPTRNPNVIFKALATGAVLYATADEVYFGLNPVGVRIWELLPPAQETLDGLCAVLCSEYPDVPADVIRADVLEVLEDLANAGLVERAGAPKQSVS